MYETIAMEADAEAKKHDWMAKHTREMASGMLSRLGYTRLESGFGSTRNHVAQAQAPYIAQAEEHERKAAEFRAKAASARRGVIAL